MLSGEFPTLAYSPYKMSGQWAVESPYIHYVYAMCICVSMYKLYV